MRIEQAAVNVQRSGKFEETQFKIKASSKAFDILSSKLYSDPHLAIVRELSTNAWDAHVEAGTEKKQFEVHLPNKMEPFFSIRDYGTGMSHEDVMQLYTTYFESTKTKTNKQVGALGLGSKSPFAYTDNFSVTSWFNGKKRVYSMFKGEQGFPKVALMQTIDSDEHNGVQVQFACRTEDTEIFLRKAKQVYKKFPRKPLFIGSSTFILEESKIVIRGKGWRIYERAAASYAVMGCIAYPLHGHYLKYELRHLVNIARLDIDFPIGALEIAANREELQYSEFTKKALEKALCAIRDELADLISEKFEGCKTLWEARCLFQKLFMPYNAPFTSLRDTVGSKVKWRNKQVDGNYFDISSAGEAIVYNLKKNINRDFLVRRTNEVVNIHPSSDIQFMIDDLDTKSGEKIRSWMKFEKAGSVKEVVVIELKSWNRTHEDELHRILGTSPRNFKLTSSLPKPVRKNPTKRRTSGTVKTTPIESRGFIFTDPGSYIYNNKSAWTEEVIDVNTPGVYVGWRKHQAEIGDNTLYPSRIQEILKLLDKMGRKPKVLYAFKAGYVERVLNKQPKWEDLLSYSKRCLKEFIQSKNLAKQIEAKRGADFIDEFDKLEEIAKLITKPSPLKKFVNKVIGAKNIQEDIATAITLADKIFYQLGRASLKEEADKIKEMYPMIKWVLTRYYYHDQHGQQRFADCAKYVQMIDKMRG